MMSNMIRDIEAVRWATSRSALLGSYNYTKWHATEDSQFTLCKLPIILASLHGTFLPESDVIEAVTCKHCKRLLEKYR
jgi:hypothetical protein